MNGKPSEESTLRWIGRGLYSAFVVVLFLLGSLGAIGSAALGQYLDCALCAFATTFLVVAHWRLLKGWYWKKSRKPG